MSQAEYMGVSPSQVSDQNGNHSSLKQTKSEEVCEFGAQYIHGEPLESKHLLGYEAVQIDPQGTSSGVSKNPDDEKLPTFCGDVLDNSFTEHLVLPPEDVSKNSPKNDTLYSQQNASEQKHEIGSKCVHTEQLEQKRQLDFHIVCNEPRESSSVIMINCDKSPKVCSSIDNNKLQPVSQDVSKLSQNYRKQTIEFCSGNGCIELNADCVCHETSEEKHQLGSEIIHNEAEDTTAVVPSGSVQKNLQTISEDVTKIIPTELNADCVCHEMSEEKHQLGSEIIHNEAEDTAAVVPSGSVKKILQTISEDVTKIIPTELNADCVCHEMSEEKHQLGSEIIHNEAEDTAAVVPSGSVPKNLQTISEDVTKIIPTELLNSPSRDANNSCQAGEKLCPQQSTSEQTLEVTAGIASHEPLEVNNKLDFQLVQNKPTEISTAISCNIAAGESGSPAELVNKSSPIEHLKQTEVPIRSLISEHLEPYSDDISKSSSLERLETPSKYAVNNSRNLGCNGKKASKALKKKYLLRSLRGSDRVLCTRSGFKALESSNTVADVSSVRGRPRKKQKTRRGKIVPDEYSRIRTHLRYLVNRINYELSLIAAYSGEGWKGLSIEKLKPEKELQRATSEILRRKLKIRDLFQHLDSLCAEGRFPKSLFDSEGQIDSEDIFCAKCGSKDLSADNDIILCDGACDRGFHQYCLEPPLLKEDIPPDDEGWLCPGCDCKVDCIDLVNESQGTNLFINDKWEKVFPEAAAAVECNQDRNFVFPSDESDDNDYDPDGPPNEEEDHVDESSSDESDFTSASDDLAVASNDKEYLGLPSDDSEDDEYNPDAPEVGDKVMQESSSSDFTSDSEDLAADLEDSGSSGNEDGTTSISPPRDSNGERSKLGGNKESLNNELFSAVESGEDGAALVYGKRSIERLDYKRLYNETYGHAPSDSSDDEDWTESAGPMKKTKSTGEGYSASPNGNAPGTRSGKTTKDAKINVKEAELIPKRRGCRKLNSGDTNVSHEGSSTPASLKRERSSYRRLGEDITRKLYKSFNENHYPDRSKKEALMKELGLTFSQVSKWFENTRWSFNHSSSMNARMGAIALEKRTCTPQSNNRSVRRVNASNVTENVESPKAVVDGMGYSSKNVKDSEVVTEEVSRKKPTPQTSRKRKRKRKGKFGHQASCRDSKIEVIHGLLANSPKVQETQTNGRTRRRKNSAG